MKLFLKYFFDPLKEINKEVQLINKLEEDLKDLKAKELKEKSLKLKEKAKEGLDNILPESFALVRETAKRTLGQRHFDVQLTGGIVMHRGGIAEMKTGEGKTLASTAPIYLNALSGKGVHVVTVNEYLAKRDTVWMGQIYYALGLKTACLVYEGAFLYDPEFKISEEELKEKDEIRDRIGSFKVQEDFLRPISRKEAYLADITYGTNHEFGFDYLRDNLTQKKEDQVQRPYFFAMIDEVDSILIDEARTPLIISTPDKESSEFYKKFSRIADRLKEGEDYVVDEKLKTVSVNDSGIDKVEKEIGISNIYSPENMRLVHYLEESLRAKALFKKDKNYVIKEGEIIIVDEFTGRLMQGRRYSGGLHQAIEAKEGVYIKEESKTFAKVSIQNYFKMYPKIAGMTGTAKTSEEEFNKVYGMDVITIPTNSLIIRIDRPDAIYKNAKAKMEAIAKKVKEAQEKGQPVLIGTTSIEKNEVVSIFLAKSGIKHEVLNAKNHEREGEIIAQAGRPGAVMVATNMAGRGVDIVLGGNPYQKEEAEKVKNAGGLLVVGTERHEARRIDNQLQGRSGRQGDPGESQFYLSLEDDLLRVFGGDKIKGIMDRFDFPDDQPIDMKIVSRSIIQAQKRVEGFNFDARKHLLEYDDVLNRQREAVYRYRQEVLEKEDIKQSLDEILKEHLSMFKSSLEERNLEENDEEELKKFLEAIKVFNDERKEEFSKIFDKKLDKIKLFEFLKKTVLEKAEEIAEDQYLKLRILGILDMLWMNHLDDMEALAESVRLRAYGQKDPLIEYRREGHILFDNLFKNFRGWVFENIFRLTSEKPKENTERGEIREIHQHKEQYKGVGRNNPCPCGSGKKYKKCHGK